jgi:hypothetical protein
MHIEKSFEVVLSKNHYKIIAYSKAVIEIKYLTFGI